MPTTDSTLHSVCSTEMVPIICVTSPHEVYADPGKGRGQIKEKEANTSQNSAITLPNIQTASFPLADQPPQKG